MQCRFLIGDPRWRAAVGLALSLLAAACGHTGKQSIAVAPAPALAPLPGLEPRERIAEAIQRLRKGKAEEARVELMAALAVDPGNHRAHRLLTQLDVDPRQLLGEKNYPYKVLQGETLYSLSRRLLGDPLLFYALARYNGLASPEGVVTGQTLLIPGVAPKKVVTAPAKRSASAKSVAVAPATPTTASAAANPVQASRLRRSALEHMSRGQIDRAEALLQQARALDPSSPLIQADLDRARRIQASVRPRS